MIAVLAVIVCIFFGIRSGPVAQTKDFYVADYAKVLSQSTIDYLVAQNYTLGRETGARFFIVTVNSTGIRDTEEYAFQIADEWKLAETDLLLVAVPDSYKFWFISGWDWSPALYDTGADLELMDTYLAPDFDAGRYDQAIRSFFDATCAYLANSVSTNVVPQYPVYDGGDYYYDGGYYYSYGVSGVFALIVVLVVIMVIVIAVSSRTRRYSYGPYYAPYYPRPPRRRWWGGYHRPRYSYRPPPPPRRPPPPPPRGGGFFGGPTRPPSGGRPGGSGGRSNFGGSGRSSSGRSSFGGSSGRSSGGRSSFGGSSGRSGGGRSSFGGSSGRGGGGSRGGRSGGGRK